jgi:hypothetical protein
VANVGKQRLHTSSSCRQAQWQAAACAMRQPEMSVCTCHDLVFGTGSSLSAALFFPVARSQPALSPAKSNTQAGGARGACD